MSSVCIPCHVEPVLQLLLSSSSHHLDLNPNRNPNNNHNPNITGEEVQNTQRPIADAMNIIQKAHQFAPSEAVTELTVLKRHAAENIRLHRDGHTALGEQQVGGTYQHLELNGVGIRNLLQFIQLYSHSPLLSNDDKRLWCVLCGPVLWLWCLEILTL